jgi:hypothetical protein
VARLLADHPAWVRAGGNIAELDVAVLRAGGGRLGFEELRALRSVVYRAQGARLAAHSRESLEGLIDQVWAQRSRLTRESAAAVARGHDAADPIYDLYSAATEANPLTRSSGDYLRDVADIAAGRPRGAISNVQATGEGITELAQAGRLGGSRLERTFFRFERAGADLGEVGERVYLNVASDHATDAMRAVVRDIVDRPTEFPGVGMAKLTGPAAVGRRADAIVIYAKDAAAAERVMGRIRGYHATNPQWFKAGTPRMTEQVLEGVSLGSEPLGSGGRISFGQLRSEVIQRALARSVARGDTKEQFMQEVLEALRRAGVDPDRPHLNLPSSG